MKNGRPAGWSDGMVGQSIHPYIEDKASAAALEPALDPEPAIPEEDAKKIYAPLMR